MYVAISSIKNRYFLKAVSSHKLKFLIILKTLFAILYNSIFTIFSKVLYFIMQYKENIIFFTKAHRDAPNALRLLPECYTNTTVFSVCMGERLGS